MIKIKETWKMEFRKKNIYFLLFKIRIITREAVTNQR